MLDAKPSPSPLSSTVILILHDGSPATNSTQCRKIIGALQYLNLTRPDISFFVNKLSQFMHKSITLHFQHLKRLLRYLKSTINFGIILKKPHSFQLLAYNDNDWGGNPDNRTSTSAYIIFFGGNTIPWLSKKKEIITCSFTVSEYHTVATTTTKITWLTNLSFM